MSEPTRHDGGPAFPMPERHYVRHYDAEGELTGSTESLAQDEDAAWEGISARDYFAAKAMSALVRVGACDVAPQIASDAYRMADAMLAERAK
jgi:hypothetical protein